MPQSPFDFTAEIGMARRIDDVDLHALVDHAGVLGPDRDPALTFLVHRVHDPFAHIVDLAMDMGLAEHGVDQCRFAMVDVGDDGDIPDIASTVLRGAYGGHDGNISLMDKKKTPRYRGVGKSIHERLPSHKRSFG